METRQVPTASKFTLLRQLCNHIPPHLVPQVARDTGVDEQARTFSPWSHGVSLGYAQLTHSIGLNDAGVNVPTLTKVMLASDRPAPVEAAGLGPMPHGFPVGACGPLVIDRRRSEKDADGHVTAAFPAGTRGRYVTVSQQGMSWLMLSEICVIAGGANVALSAPYPLFPPPTPAAATQEHQTGEKLRYPDDRVRLTDGIVAQSFNPSQVTGWRGKENHAVTVELPEVRPVSKIRIWVLRGGQAGIFAPEQVTVALARDATTWTTPLPARKPKGPPEDGTTCEAAALDVVFPSGATAQQVRIVFVPGRGWTMVSEIEIQ